MIFSKSEDPWMERLHRKSLPRESQRMDPRDPGLLLGLSSHPYDQRRWEEVVLSLCLLPFFLAGILLATMVYGWFYETLTALVFATVGIYLGALIGFGARGTVSSPAPHLKTVRG